MAIDDPASPERNVNTLANRITEEPTNGNALTSPVPAPLTMSLPDLVKLLGQSWRTVILAVSSKDGTDTVSMTLKHGDIGEALKLCGSLSASIQNGV